MVRIKELLERSRREQEAKSLEDIYWENHRRRMDRLEEEYRLASRKERSEEMRKPRLKQPLRWIRKGVKELFKEIFSAFKSRDDLK